MTVAKKQPAVRGPGGHFAVGNRVAKTWASQTKDRQRRAALVEAKAARVALVEEREQARCRAEAAVAAREAAYQAWLSLKHGVEWSQQDTALEQMRVRTQAIHDRRGDLRREFESDPAPTTPLPPPARNTTGLPIPDPPGWQSLVDESAPPSHGWQR